MASKPATRKLAEALPDAPRHDLNVILVEVLNDAPDISERIMTLLAERADRKKGASASKAKPTKIAEAVVPSEPDAGREIAESGARSAESTHLRLVSETHQARDLQESPEGGLVVASVPAQRSETSQDGQEAGGTARRSMQSDLLPVPWKPTKVVQRDRKKRGATEVQPRVQA